MFTNLLASQLIVLSELTKADEVSGRELRVRLEMEMGRRSIASFYQFMADLEEARLVTGRYNVFQRDGRTIKERVYRITGAGTTAFEAASLDYGRLFACDSLEAGR